MIVFPNLSVFLAFSADSVSSTDSVVVLLLFTASSEVSLISTATLVVAHLSLLLSLLASTPLLGPWFMSAVSRYWGCLTSIALKHFPHMSYLKVTLCPGQVSAQSTYAVILCLVALITLEIFQISGIIGSFGSLVASSASSDEVEIKKSLQL